MRQITLYWYCGVDARPQHREEKILIKTEDELSRYIRAMKRSHPAWKLLRMSAKEMPKAKVYENPEYEKANYKRKYFGVGHDFGRRN